MMACLDCEVICNLTDKLYTWPVFDDGLQFSIRETFSNIHRNGIQRGHTHDVFAIWLFGCEFPHEHFEYLFRTRVSYIYHVIRQRFQLGRF